MREEAKMANRIAPAPQPEDATAKRLTGYLRAIADEFPGIWKEVDHLRQASAWPPYVFLPSREWINRLPDNPAAVALAAWRPTQGIYRFDAEVLDALWDTPMDGTLPGDVLRSLPEWCVYIDSAPADCLHPASGNPILGYWAWLDWDRMPTGDTERLYFAVDDGRYVCTLLPVALGEGSLLDGIERSARAVRQSKRYTLLTEEDRAIVNSCNVPLILKQLIGPVLYLCSINAEIRTRKEGLRPTRPRAVKTRDGLRLFPPAQPTAWDCAWRIGAAIRSAREQEHRRAGDGTHASPRPHVRRAHWHSFWTGAKAKVGIVSSERKLVLKWLPPIAVMVGEASELVPAIHHTFRDL
jgi:hypothetical protein